MGTPKLALSVVMITKNGGKHIAKVLDAVQDIANEIIVVDSGSTDKTLDIAKIYHAKIYQTTTWPGFGVQRKYALSLATQDWVLILDDDEVVSDELKASIIEAVNANKAAAYKIEYIMNFCGGWLHHTKRDSNVRLVPRKEAWYNIVDIIAEEVKFPETLPIVKLQGAIWHYSLDNFELVLQKLNYYSSLKAEMVSKTKKYSKCPSFGRAIMSSWWKFMRTYFQKGAILDGKYGFMFAVFQAEQVYYRYLKIMLLKQISKKDMSPS